MADEPTFKLLKGESEESKANSHSYRFKCLACGLHFEIHSWDADWMEQHGDAFCPECGNKGNRKVMFGPTNNSQHIFELVPGDATMRRITGEGK